MEKLRKKGILSILVGVMVVSYALLGAYQVNRNVEGAISLLRTVLVYPSTAITKVNNFIKDAVDGEKAAKPVRKKDTDRSGKGLILLMFSSVTLGNGNIALLFMLTLLLSAVYAGKTLSRGYSSRGRPPDLRYMRWCGLLFITPVEKCIRYLSDKYDINPILGYGRAVSACKKPAFCYIGSRMRAFFMRGMS